MSIELPDQSLIIKKFPQIDTIEYIAKGGFKVVYRAKISGNQEAIKLIQIPSADDSEESQGNRKESIGRIEREVLALKKCKSPELVKLGMLEPQITQLLTNEYFIYSEEFVSGKNLYELIKAKGQKPKEDELRVLAITLLRAIKELWDHGYIHRDIKPCNIIKTDDCKRPFVLLDLGIAFSVKESALTFNPQERPATSLYFAPEMADPNFRQNIDYRSDLYNSALSIYEYACFQHPLARSGDDVFVTISRAIRQTPPPLKSKRGDLSDEFCQVIDQALKKKPALRPSNIRALIKILEGSL